MLVRGRGWIVALVLAGLLLPIATLFVRVPEAEAAGQVVCRMGLYVISIHDLNPNGGTFTAEFWLWTVCPTSQVQPLKTLEFVNANDVQISLYKSRKVKRSYWAEEKVTGNFRYAWDLSAYPFDHHDLKIQLEDSSLDLHELRFAADTTDSTVAHPSNIEGWDVDNFRVSSVPHAYETNFGVPGEKPGAHTTVSQINVDIGVSRSDDSEFILLATPVYIAFLLALSSFFLFLEDTVDRIAIIATALFAVVINLLDTTNVLGKDVGFSLVGGIHLLAMTYILAISSINIILWRHFGGNGHHAALLRIGVRFFWGMLLSFVAINIVLIALFVA